MGQALYRKHRSKSFDEVVGQDHITTTLKNALKKGTISHAYLFTGPRGVGKTSVARLLAYAVNDLPYNEQESHLDIIEIDAASNRRIDEVRDLRDKIHIAPTSGKYKVYIIDEVHMLTKEAFNALLKTLEEPPAHVIFILATTEAYKLPETIISRTQRFTFRPIDYSQMSKHLAEVAKQEKIKIEPPALDLIASHSEGSLRDGLSMLDQLSGIDGPVNVQTVEQHLGLAPSGAVGEILSKLNKADANRLLELLNELYSQGIQASQLARQIGQNLRQDIIDSNAPPSQHTLALLKALIEVPASHDPDRLLEVTLLENLRSGNSVSNLEVKSKTIKSKPNEATAKSPVPPKKDEPFAEYWPEVLKAIKQQNSTLYGILRMGAPQINGSSLTIRFRFPFHQKRVSENKNSALISRTFHDVTGQQVSITSIVDENIEPELKEQNEPEPSHNNQPIDNISNIFGGGEVLES